MITSKTSELVTEFKGITGLKIPFVFGMIDICQLDEMLGEYEDGISMAQYLERTYGSRAKEIIEELLSVGV